MNSKYLTCYRRIGNEFTIYFNDKSKLHARLSACHDHLNIYGLPNSYLFEIFSINKFELTRKLNYKYSKGDWPVSNKKGTVALLNALIKETKIRYYASTEI